MKKKTIIWIVVAVLAICAAVAAFMFAFNGGQTEEKTENVRMGAGIFTTSKGGASKGAASQGASVIVYADLNQLAEKGAFDSYLADIRKLFASVISAELGGTKEAKQLKEIVTDLDALGIDTGKPVCCYLSEEMTEFVIVASVLDADKLDNSVELLSYFLEESGEEGIDVRNQGGVRIIDDEYYAVAYNASAIAFTAGQNGADINVAKNAIAAQVDLSKFAGKDLAVMVYVDGLMKAGEMSVNASLDMYEEWYEEGYISKSEYNDMKKAYAEYEEAVKECDKYFEPNANIMLSLTFDMGRATLACDVEGVKNNEYMESFKSVNLEHLNNLSKDVYAVMGMGVNGERFAKYLEEYLTDDVLKSLGIRPTSEVRMVMSIAGDALSSIDGDITVALDSIDGTFEGYYDSYWDEYDYYPVVNSVEAMLMVDVNDSYIISNVGQLAGGFLDKIDKNHYSLYYDGYLFSLGQDNNVLYAGVNMEPEAKRRSAKNADWVKDVEGSVSYMVVDIDAILSNNFICELLNESTNASYQERELIYGILDLFSYAYIASNLTSSELVLVFDDQKTNALEQISDALLPFLIDECVENLY